MNKRFSDRLSQHSIRALAVLAPALPIAVLYSQVPFAWWKVLSYELVAYAIAFAFSYAATIKNHKLHCLGVLITLLFVGTCITVVQDLFMPYPANLGLWELLGLSLVFLTGSMVVFALIFWIYWKLDGWICQKLNMS